MDETRALVLTSDVKWLPYRFVKWGFRYNANRYGPSSPNAFRNTNMDALEHQAYFAAVAWPLRTMNSNALAIATAILNDDDPVWP